jgi:hypothetical protein
VRQPYRKGEDSRQEVNSGETEAEIRPAVPAPAAGVRDADDRVRRRQTGLIIHVVVSHRGDEHDVGIVLERQAEEPETVLPLEPIRFAPVRPEGRLRDASGKKHQEPVVRERPSGFFHAARRHDAISGRDGAQYRQPLPAHVSHEARHAAVALEDGGDEQERIDDVERMVPDQHDATAGAQDAEQALEVEDLVAMVGGERPCEREKPACRPLVARELDAGQTRARARGRTVDGAPDEHAV